MDASGNPPEIFDRQRRRALRERAGTRAKRESFMWQHIAEDIAERLSMVSRQFDAVLLIGPIAAYAPILFAGRKLQFQMAALSTSEATKSASVIEEDRLPFAPESFDLIICAGTFDSVNDLPGALVQLRRCLRPDGLFLGHMFGAGSLRSLKAAMIAADGSEVSAHIHPQVDLGSAADLLSRVGFALPVVDQDKMTVRYSEWRRLVEDIRDLGVGNALAGRQRYLGKGYIDRLDLQWRTLGDGDGKTSEEVVHINMSGWAPSPDQPKPAKRGSGVSLAKILPVPNQLKESPER